MRKVIILAALLIACGGSGSDGGSAADAQADVAVDATADAASDGAVPPDAAPDASPDAVPAPTTLAFPVEGAGPFGAGYRTWEHTYTGPRGERTVTLHAWYPTEATAGEHPSYRLPVPDPISLVDAPAADPVGDAYPVYVYSHGHQGFAATGAGVAARLARHGWVVLAPDHVGDLLNAFPDAALVAHFIERPLDLSAALDALAALPASDPLSRAATARVVMAGHSRGTYTAWALAGATFDADGIAGATDAERAAFAAGFRDPRVVAVLPLAGTPRADFFGADGHLAVTLPVLTMSGSKDNPAAAKALFDAAGDLDLTWVELAGGCHETFALGFCDTLDPELGFDVVSTYALAFARAHLLGDTDAKTLDILRGAWPVSATATVSVNE